jgi:Zn-dependent protease
MFLGPNRAGHYTRLGAFKVFGAPVYVHWTVFGISTFALVIYLRQPIMVAIGLGAFFCIIFVHEFGHAWIAHRLGYRVFALRIALFHGLCEFEAPHYEWDDVRIAWGGVLAQMVVAVLIFAISFLGANQFAYFAPILMFLGRYNLWVIPWNLLPLPGLDGYKAWRIIPILRRKWRL